MFPVLPPTATLLHLIFLLITKICWSEENFPERGYWLVPQVKSINLRWCNFHVCGFPKKHAFLRTNSSSLHSYEFNSPFAGSIVESLRSGYKIPNFLIFWELKHLKRIMFQVKNMLLQSTIGKSVPLLGIKTCAPMDESIDWTFSPPIIADWWFGTFFPYIGNGITNHPNWLSVHHFSEG